jgi:hypothetical protein
MKIFTKINFAIMVAMLLLNNLPAQTFTTYPFVLDNGSGISGPPTQMGTSLYYPYINNANKGQILKFDATGAMSLISNLSTGDAGINSGAAGVVYGSNIYFVYTNGSNKQQIAKCNGSSISLLNNFSGADQGAVSSNTYPNLTVCNGALYYIYKNASNISQLAKYDGTNLTLVTNPDAGSGFYGTPIVYNNNLYCVYRNASNKRQLAKYDGTNLTLITNPDAAAGPQVQQSFGSNFMVLGSSLYFPYTNSSGANQLAKYDGTTVSLVTNPDASTICVSFNGSQIVYNNALYFQYYNTSSKGQLAKYDGTSFSLITNANTIDNGYYGYPIIYNNALYIAYNSNTLQLAKYTSGTSLTLIANPNTTDQGYANNAIVYGNNLYFPYQTTTNKFRLAQFDGTSVTLVNNLNTSDVGPYGFLTIFNNKLYLDYVANGINYLTLFTPAATTINWTGASDPFWSTASNWSTGYVPGAADNAVIYNIGSSPIINGTQAIKDLNIVSGANIAVNGGTLQIGGAISGTGTISASVGTIEFNGTSNQTIPDGLFVNNTIQNLSLVSSYGGVTLGGPLTVTGLVSPSTLAGGGVLASGGYLTLASSASGTASVGASALANYITGAVTVQRYIPGGRRAFRFLAHPFTGNLNMSSLTDNIDITGSGGTPFTTSTTNAASAFSYTNANANSSATTDPGWTALTTSSRFNSLTGYRILIRGSKGQAGSLTAGTYTPDAVTLDWTGTLNTGDKTISTVYNGAGKTYNLIGNPYPCPMQLSSATVGSYINANYTVWDANAGTRGAYVTKLLSDNSYYVPSGAAFFVQNMLASGVAGNSDITINESCKITSTPVSLFGTGNNKEPQLVLQVNNTDGNYEDQLQFLFGTEKYTAQYDGLWDATKMINPDVNFYSFSKDGTQLAIDRRPFTNDTIALGFKTTAVGTYQLLVKELPSNSNISLIDKLNKTSTLLVAGKSIDINITADVTSQGDNRFALVISKGNSNTMAVLDNTTVDKLTVNTTVTPGNIVVNYAAPKAVLTTIRLIGSNGELLNKNNLGQQQSGKLTLSTAAMAKGLYIVEVVMGEDKVVKKVITQ